MELKAGPVALPKGLALLQKVALGVGILAAAAVVAGFFNTDAKTFFEAYLFGFMFWFGIAAGSFAIMMLHQLTGPGWGFSIVRILEASARNIPLMLVLSIPILLGIQDLYLWAAPGAEADHILHQKLPYLNSSFFIVRWAIYFVFLIGLSTLMVRWSARQDESGDGKISNKLSAVSGPGLVFFFLTMTFAAFDWLMSLDPHWFSSIYGVMVIVGMGLSTFAFSILVLKMLADEGGPLEGLIDTDKFHDLGKLMLAFVMLWGYTQLSQFLIIWSANLPEEITWYIARTHEGWEPLTVFLFAAHFFLPFFLLLTRHTKRNTKWLAMIAGYILMMRLVELYWLIKPTYHDGHVEHLSFHWLFVATPLAIGGVFLFVFFWHLKARALLPVRDPRLEEALHGHH